MLDGVPAVDLDTVEHLDAAEALGGAEAQGDGEEVVRVAGDGELHAAALVVRVDERMLPEQRAMPRVVSVLSVTLRHVRRAHAARDGDGDDDVLQLEVGVLQLVLDVDVAAAGAVVAGPAVDGEGDVGLLGAGEAPLQNTHT